MNTKLKVAVVVTASAASLLAILRHSWAQTETNAEAAQQVRKVEEERRQATLQNDVKALDLLLAPEYTAVFQINGGIVTTKGEELAFDRPDARQVESWNPSDVSIRSKL